MQQALLRYYGNAVKDIICHNIFATFSKGLIMRCDGQTNFANPQGENTQ
jgi:hypothetical protein